MPQLMFYRYVDDYEANLILQNRRIEPAPHQTRKYYTPDLYNTGAEAQAFLALSYQPTHRVGALAIDLSDFDAVPLQIVQPDNNQHGGGLEAATTQSVPLPVTADITPIP